MASKYLQKFPVPEKFPDILHDFAREVLRDQPADIIHYASEYFKAMDEGIEFDYPYKGSGQGGVPPGVNVGGLRKPGEAKPESKKREEIPLQHAKPVEEPKAEEPAPVKDKPATPPEEPAQENLDNSGMNTEQQNEKDAQDYVGDMIEKVSNEYDEEDKDKEAGDATQAEKTEADKEKEVTMEEEEKTPV